jgi:NAD(P)-dependent dehydrogenase (short-subunit alcohol dehydrogenase family)
MVCGSRSDPHYYVPDKLLSKDLSGKIAIVTGGNAGFGKDLSAQLASQGALVVIACRRLANGEAAAAEINGKGGKGSCVAAFLDLADLGSVKAFAEGFLAQHKKLHILVENAAVNLVGNTPTTAGFNPYLGVNHFGHFLLRHLLEPTLAASAPSRVVVVSSALHDQLFTKEPTVLDFEDPHHLGWTTDPNIDPQKQWMAYARSKLANVLSAKAAAQRLAAKGVVIVSLHPGVDATTTLFRSSPAVQFIFNRLLIHVRPGIVGLTTRWQSLQTHLYCLLEDEAKLTSGAYYSQHYGALYRDGSTGGWPMKQSPNPFVTAENAAKLEALSYEVLGLTSYSQPDTSMGA